MNADTGRVAPTPDASTSTDIPTSSPQDWELLVTPGHVRGNRLLAASKAYGLPIFATAVAGTVLAISAFGGSTHSIGGGIARRITSQVAAALVPDMDTYADLPGWGRTTFRLHWVAGAVGRPQRGLSPQAWEALLIAAGTDVARAGANVDAYDEIPKLAVAPKVTRPARAFREFSDRLATGIVALPPSQPSGAYVLAWVDGRLFMAAVGPRQCLIILGDQVPSGCSSSVGRTLAADGSEVAVLDFGTVLRALQEFNPATTVQGG